MRMTATFLGLLLFGTSLGSAPPQQQRDECGFTLQGEPTKPTITGPDDIVPLVYVVAQPDSPIEVLSADFTGTSLSVSNEQYSFRSCAKVSVHNRSDRPVQGFQVQDSIGPHLPTLGFRFPGLRSSPLAPGQTAEINFCGGGGHGGAPGNRVSVFVFVSSIDWGGCLYQPSLRAPRELAGQ
jgi:hypothetical protein